MAELPTGTLTFLFADVEGSTRLLTEFGGAYAGVLTIYRRTIRENLERNGGVEVDTEGDGLFAVFETAPAAVSAARAAQEALAEQPLEVRIGIHTGEALATDEGYVGLDVHRAARIAAAGHGGQVLVSQTTRALTIDQDFVDLGFHRLKDISAPERIFQLGGGRFPRLRSLNQTNLPMQPTPLVGRQRELHEIREHLRAYRVVTLTGAGGSGKTRLAIQAAAEAVEAFDDGVWFVSAGSLLDTRSLPPAIAQVVGASGELQAFLRGKNLLLVLDNLEHLLPEIASVVAALDVPVLATSRERLRISAEAEYPIPPLPMDVAHELFVQRARQLVPGFRADESVMKIVQKLDGLPLAVELAAAQVKVLTPRQIVERLGAGIDLLAAQTHDVPPRQRTLQATLDWSYDLLSDEEQSVFVGLAAFTGGFTLSAAEVVANARLGTLAVLVDKNLIRRVDERFEMLDVIHQYAATRLAASPDVRQIQLRCAEYFLTLARSKGRSDASTLQLVEEHDNILASLDSFRRLGLAELELELAVAASSYWHVAGYHSVGRRYLDGALARAQHASPVLRARGLARAASFAQDLGDYAEAEQLTRQRLDISDEEYAFGPFITLGISAEEQGDLARAQALFATALDNARRAKSKLGVAIALNNIGNNALARGDLGEAQRYFREGLRLARELDSSEGIAIGLNNLAFVALRKGDNENALRRWREVFRESTSIGFSGGIIWSALGIAAVEVKRDAEFATQLLGGADALLDDTERVLGHEERRLRSEVTRDAHKRLTSDSFRAAFTEGRQTGATKLLNETFQQ